jgi:hypothetical protein
MSREEMCNVLCRCGYNMSELEECSNQELEEMCRATEEEDNHLNNNTMTQEKKGEKWIKDAIKKPGSLRKSMGKKEGEKISKNEIDSELQALKGFGKYIDQVKYIYTEINTGEVYKGNDSLEDIDTYLSSFGFERVEINITPFEWGDAFYIKK